MTRAGMMAIGNIDPEVAHGPALTPFAHVIAEQLWNHRTSRKFNPRSCVR